jgi:hypothetical protein
MCARVLDVGQENASTRAFSTRDFSLRYERVENERLGRHWHCPPTNGSWKTVPYRDLQVSRVKEKLSNAAAKESRNLS